MKRGIQNIYSTLSQMIWYRVYHGKLYSYFKILNDFELLECSPMLSFDPNSTLIFMAFLNKITTWAIRLPIYE